MAKWTLKDFLYQARRRLDEFDPELFSDDELTAYINEGIQKMTQELKLKATGILFITDRDSVDFREIFVSDVEKIKPVFTDREHHFSQFDSLYLDGKKINLSTKERVLNGEEGCFFWGDTLHFKEPKSGNLKIYYVKRPKFLRLDTDTSDLDERYQDIPLEYVIAKCKQKDGEYGLYDYSLNQFYALKKQMESELLMSESVTGVSELHISDYTENI